MKKILVLNDLHAGSNYAPAMDHFVVDKISGEVKEFKASSLQKFMYNELQVIVAGNTYDALVLNGDICEGPCEKNGGRYIMSADMNDQVNLAYKIIKDNMSYKRVFATMGTPYHAVDDRPLDFMVGELLGAVNKYDLLLEVEDKTIHFGHCMDYRGGVIDSLSRELGTCGADLVVRGHRHEYGYVEKPRRKAVCAPCWQWRTNFGITNGTYSGTDIGLIEIIVDSGEIMVKPHFVNMNQFMPTTVL